MTEWIEYGYWGLFLVSFLAATILPFSSEAILSLCVYSGFDISLSLLIASLGNWLGGLTNYLLGYIGKLERIEKWLKIKPDKALKTKNYLRNKGNVMAFFAFLPIVGDLIPLGLGLLRTNVYWMAFFMAIGKFSRYIFLAWLTMQALN